MKAQDKALTLKAAHYVDEAEAPEKCPQIRTRPGTMTNSQVVHHPQVFPALGRPVHQSSKVTLSVDKGY